jgi:hypothetical protein
MVQHGDLRQSREASSAPSEVETASPWHCHGNSGGGGIVTVTGVAGVSRVGEDGVIKKPPDPHYRHRFPVELISHAVWLYHVFSLSFREVELILAERGVVVSGFVSSRASVLISSA